MKRNLWYLLFVAVLVLKGSCAYATEGALRGKFAISTTDTVAFSRGNLQYQPSTSTWRFAENQWDFVGTDNERIRDYQWSSTGGGWVWNYQGWLDLFGWGTGKRPNTSTTYNTDYSSFDDWGNNAISNGGNTPNQWWTLSVYDWDYLYNNRRNAAELRANGKVNGVNGAILLPDNWILPEGMHFKPSNSTDSTLAPNNYTADEWMIMEMAGAVFLPVTYERTMTSWSTSYCTSVYVAQSARYWTATQTNANGAYYFVPYGTPVKLMDNRYVGKGVRLVQNHDGSELFPVVPNTNSAIFQWKSVPNAETYTLHVYSDSTRTEEAFYITFDRDGKVTGLHFVHHAPSRKAKEETDYSPRLFFYTLKGLQSNREYWYAISGEDAEGATLQTTQGSFKTAAIEAATDRVTVDPAETSAVFMWPTDSAANTYQIDIYKDGATFCHLTLGPTGTLVGISFNANAKKAPADTTIPTSLSFNVTGLDAASRYNYVLSVLDANGTPIHVYTGAFATTGYTGGKPVGDGVEVIPTPPIIPGDPEAQITTDIPNVQRDKVQCTKVLRNGQILFILNGKTYSITGQLQ